VARPRTIVAGGGGGFRTDPGNALDTFLLARTGVPHPNVAFLPTAGGDPEPAIEAFTRSFLERGARPTAVRLFQREVTDLAGLLLAQDLILVSGGNTANLLAIWRVHGVDKILAEAWARGIVLAGWSAGGLCWFEGGVTDSFHPTDLAPLSNLLGFLPGSFCPHYDSELTRRPLYHAFVRAGALAGGFAAEDSVGLVFEDARLVEAVTFRPGARAYRVVPDAAAPGGVAETALPTRLLVQG